MIFTLPSKLLQDLRSSGKDEHYATHIASQFYTVLLSEPFIAWESNFKPDDEKSPASHCVILQLPYNSDSLTQNLTWESETAASKWGCIDCVSLTLE